MTKDTEIQEIDFDINGMSKDDVMTALIAEYGMSFKEATDYWGEYGGTKRTGFRATFYKQLEEQDLTSEEVKQFCKDFGSKNDAKAWSHYDAIAKLVASIRA